MIRSLTGRSRLRLIRRAVRAEITVTNSVTGSHSNVPNYFYQLPDGRKFSSLTFSSPPREKVSATNSNNLPKLLNKNLIDLVIYHGSCWDGFGAAWAANYYLRDCDSRSKAPKFFPARHGASPPDVRGLNILIVDFCYPLKTMEKLLSDCESLLVIDHHVSSEQDILSLPAHNKQFVMSESGAMLTWKYFYPDREPPQLISYIADKDMWRFNLPDSMSLSHALSMKSQSMEQFDALIARGDEGINSLISEGKGIKSYIESQLQRLLSKAQKMKFSRTGHTVSVVNSPLHKSELGNLMAEKKGIDFAIIWHYEHASKALIISVRSTDHWISRSKSEETVTPKAPDQIVDVSQIAGLFGGGGHKMAAAFKFYGRIDQLVSSIQAPAKNSKSSSMMRPIDEGNGNQSSNERIVANDLKPYIAGLTLISIILYLMQIDELELEAPETSNDSSDKVEVLPSTAEANPSVVPQKPRLVILGSGWGAVSLLKGLKNGEYDVTVVSPRNYFLFTPLLPSATTGQVESRSLMEPIRRICHRIKARYYEGKAVDVNLKDRLVICRSYNGHEFTVPYDQLVVAVGAKNNTFDTPNVRDYCYFLKEIKHARKIRHKLLSLLEEASLPGLTKEEREKMLHVLVVGGGPTGVEFAAEFHDLLTQDIRALFPDLAQHVSLSLIQSQDHILNTYDKTISEYAESEFKKQDIRLITGARVQSVKPDKVIYLDKKTKQLMEIPFGLCVWSTGIDTVQFTKQLQSRLPDAQDVKGKVVLTDNRLRVEGAESEGRIYAVGDSASVAPPRHISDNPEALKRVFADIDVDADGFISYEEFYEMASVAVREYPVLTTWLQTGRLRDLFNKYDKDKNSMIDKKEFEQVIIDIERNVKSYPATAQVASQQGEYLAKRFNAMAKKGFDKPVQRVSVIQPALLAVPSASQTSPQFAFPLPVLDPSYDSPFQYKHLASLAYTGNEHAAIDLGDGRSVSGWSAYWLWKSIYFSTSVSMRTRILLASDWARSWIFGRDVSKR